MEKKYIVWRPKKITIRTPAHGNRATRCGCKSGFGSKCGCNHKTCKKRKAGCFIPSRIDICDDQVHLRLAGLTGNLNFQFMRFKGCKVTVELDGGHGVSKVTGNIGDVGTDFVDLVRRDGTVVTVLQHHIVSVRWDEPRRVPDAREHARDDREHARDDRKHAG